VEHIWPKYSEKSVSESFWVIQTPPGVLCQLLVSPVQDRHQRTGECPAKGDTDD